MRNVILGPAAVIGIIAIIVTVIATVTTVFDSSSRKKEQIDLKNQIAMLEENIVGLHGDITEVILPAAYAGPLENDDYASDTFLRTIAAMRELPTYGKDTMEEFIIAEMLSVKESYLEHEQECDRIIIRREQVRIKGVLASERRQIKVLAQILDGSNSSDYALRRARQILDSLLRT